MRKAFQKLLILFVMCSSTLASADNDSIDPFDPFDFGFDVPMDEEADKDRSAEQLMLDARLLLEDERLLDARVKLLRALKKDPNDFRVHILLSHYYLAHVGHFRLALKYVLRAQQLFKDTKGSPPYKNSLDENTHSQILYLLSQVRLNLDNYKGALDTLDEFSSYGYPADWYPGSRAWVLMKLGRIDEAIQVARAGVLLDSEPGRILNTLGILLSLKGDREGALKVLREAIAYEIGQGPQGQPATPLNNQGEVYEEMFDDENAEDPIFVRLA